MMTSLEDWPDLAMEQLMEIFTDVQKAGKKVRNANLPRFMLPAHFTLLEKVMIIYTKVIHASKGDKNENSISRARKVFPS